MKKIPCLCLLLLLVAGWCYGQSNEVSFSSGAALTSGQTMTTTATLQVPLPCPFPTCVITDTTKTNASTAFTFEASYARRFAGAGPVALYLELPIVETPGHGVGTVFSTSLSTAFNASNSSSLFFFTPSARAKFFSSARISPWATVGGGWAHLTLGPQNASTGALQFGGGVDFKTSVPHLGLRVEARDFWSANALRPLPMATGVNAGLPGGTPGVPPVQVTATTTVSPARQHHVFAGAGVVLRF